MRPLVLVLLSGACAPMAAADAALAACGVDRLAEAVGQPISEVALPTDRPVRVIRPGDAVTMDFSPARLNLELDAQDIVVQVRCG